MEIWKDQTIFGAVYEFWAFVGLLFFVFRWRAARAISETCVAGPFSVILFIVAGRFYCARPFVREARNSCEVCGVDRLAFISKNFTARSYILWRQRFIGRHFVARCFTSQKFPIYSDAKKLYTQKNYANKNKTFRKRRKSDDNCFANKTIENNRMRRVLRKVFYVTDTFTATRNILITFSWISRHFHVGNHHITHLAFCALCASFPTFILFP